MSDTAAPTRLVTVVDIDDRPVPLDARLVVGPAQALSRLPHDVELTEPLRTRLAEA